MPGSRQMNTYARRSTLRRTATEQTSQRVMPACPARVRESDHARWRRGKYAAISVNGSVTSLTYQIIEVRKLNFQTREAMRADTTNIVQYHQNRANRRQ